MNDNQSVTGIGTDTEFGMPAMSRFTGIPPRRLHYMLSKGLVPGAFRMGNSWAMLKSVYTAEIRARAGATSVSA